MAGDGLHYKPDEPDSSSESSDEYTQAASEAFPDEDWTPERVDALKALIKLCMGGADGDEGASDDKHKATLAMIFGGKPKS